MFRLCQINFSSKVIQGVRGKKINDTELIPTRFFFSYWPWGQTCKNMEMINNISNVFTSFLGPFPSFISWYLVVIVSFFKLVLDNILVRPDFSM